MIIIELQQNDDIGCSVGLEDDNNLFNWNIVFEGPSDTLYEVTISVQIIIPTLGRLLQNCA